MLHYAYLINMLIMLLLYVLLCARALQASAL